MELNVHPKSIIGYKLLTDADLGRSPTSHQTHIGLYEDTLEAFGKISKSQLGYFIYEDKWMKLPLFLDWIDNPDGSKRSPKLRKGNDDEISENFEGYDSSIVIKIREIAKEKSESNLALFWFILDDESIVFYLVEIPSLDANEIRKIIGEISSKGRLSPGDSTFSKFLEYLNKKLSDVTISYEKALEIALQTGDTELLINSPLSNTDINKVKKNIYTIGRLGEELIDHYFDIQKSEGRIISYEWKNKNTEMGLPFDFEYKSNDGKIYYTDVKTTQYDFYQEMIFSTNELKFIGQIKDLYCVHRVYGLSGKKPTPRLKILNNLEYTSSAFFHIFNGFQYELQKESLNVRNFKVGVSPISHNIKIGDEIQLNTL